MPGRRDYRAVNVKTDIRHLAIALAGVFQAVRLVQLTASGGYRDETAFSTCINGIFKTDPETAEAGFGDLPGLTIGLEAASRQLGNGKADRDMELTRYAVTVLYLERKLHRRKALSTGT